MPKDLGWCFCGRHMLPVPKEGDEVGVSIDGPDQLQYHYRTECYIEKIFKEQITDRIPHG